jgi:hypothetical protein
VYRCHVCHLELELDPETRKIRVAPVEWRADPQAKKPGTHSE